MRRFPPLPTPLHTSLHTPHPAGLVRWLVLGGTILLLVGGLAGCSFGKEPVPAKHPLTPATEPLP